MSNDMDFSVLDREERMRLFRFVCSFAWADLEVADTERKYVNDLVERLEMDSDERTQILAMLELPPAPDDVDPTEIPNEHRQLFLNAMVGMMTADGRVDTAEVETLSLFGQLLG
jgi:uncharacterized tellurite resistance protein B-like protein